MTTPIRKRLEAIQRLTATFERDPRPGWTHRATFGTHRTYTLNSGELRVYFRIYVVTPGMKHGPLASSVEVWPPGPKRRGSEKVWQKSPKAPGGWNRALVRVRWYEDCERLLRSHGYNGQWRQSPEGRFGYFWKKHRDSKSLASEVARIEELSRERFWGSRAAQRKGRTK